MPKKIGGRTGHTGRHEQVGGTTGIYTVNDWDQVKLSRNCLEASGAARHGGFLGGEDGRPCETDLLLLLQKHPNLA